MSRKNSEMILKTIKSDLLDSGGKLNPEQDKKFFKWVRGSSDVIKQLRVERLDPSRKHLDSSYLGEVVSEWADEDTSYPFSTSLKLKRVELNLDKLRSSSAVSYEFLADNIEKENFKDTLMQSLAKRVGADVELAAFNSDTSRYSSTSAYKRERLLAKKDGFMKQAEEGRVYDHAGGTVDTTLFQKMIRRLPAEYYGKLNLRWICSPRVAQAWRDLLIARATPLGDEALLRKEMPGPFGIPFLLVPELDVNLPVSKSVDTSAMVVGKNQDPFVIVASGSSQNNKLKISIDGGAAVVITLTAGTRFAGQIAEEINSAIGQTVAYDEGGRLILESPTTGAGSSIDIQSVSNSAYDTLGLAVGTYNGSAGSGTEYNGTQILLTDPKNLVIAYGKDDTRVYPEYNKDYDRFEFVIYSRIDFKIDQIDYVVLGKNIALPVL